MRCVPVRAWLLTSKIAAALPAGVERHLRRCARCRQVRARLCRLDLVAEGSPPALSHATRTAILAALPERDTTPTTAPAQPARTPTPSRWRFRVAIVAASLLASLVLGFALGRTTEDRAEPAPTPEPVPTVVSAPHLPVVPVSDTELLARLLDGYVRLADVYDPLVQVELLGRMATLLRQTAVQGAKAGAAEEVILYVGLYELVVSEGLTRRARTIPSASRPTVLTPLVRGLRDARAEVETSTRGLPAGVADLLAPLGHAAADAATEIEAGRESTPSASLPITTVGPGSTQSVAVALVTGAVGLTAEDDPLRRAALCTVATEQLSLATRAAAARGDGTRVTFFQKALAELLARGLTPNLLRVRVTDPGDPRLTEASDLVTKASLAVGQLQDAARGSDDPLLSARAKELEKRLKEARKSLEELTKPAKGPPKKDGPPRKDSPPKDVKGVVQSVDPEGRTVRLKVKDRGSEVELTYRLAADARLRIGPTDFLLKDLKAGTSVKAKLQGPDMISELRWEHSKDD